MVTKIETSGTIARGFGVVRMLIETVATWTVRARQRRRLARLPDHLLKDIGLTHASAWAEARKPFWQD
ncbi:DUF1127 domain-containing protein [Zavarzinia sp. CC-PAN008]|uniref:DUF1127 domain-containing protein n=1 Tax=Zavarzinia sp. CC-PAN008 TaxID=3243332 RepID=UPI003F745E0D